LNSNFDGNPRFLISKQHAEPFPRSRRYRSSGLFCVPVHNTTLLKPFQLSLAFLVLAIYVAVRTSYFSLPISPLASFLAVLTPLCTYPALRLAYPSTGSSKNRSRTFLLNLSPYIILALNVILLTLSADRLASPSLQSCSYHDQWLRLFKTKNAGAVRKIQDAMNCCGFKNSHDMAWPFPDKEHDQRACEVAFGRTVGCEGGLAEEGRKILAVMVVIGGVGVVCVVSSLQVCPVPSLTQWFKILAFPGVLRFRRAEWYHQGSHPHRQGQERLLTGGVEGDGEAQRISDEPYTDDAGEQVARQQAPGGENAAIVDGERQNARQE
jgi:hypothetical protein